MMNRKPTRRQLFVQRYVLTGIALGLYFGIFFRPVREPYLGYAFVLALLATIVTLGLKAYRDRQWPSLREIGMSYLQYTLLILVFELRHYAYDFGGRIAVIILTALTGAVIGYLMSRGREPASG